MDCIVLLCSLNEIFTYVAHFNPETNDKLSSSTRSLFCFLSKYRLKICEDLRWFGLYRSPLTIFIMEIQSLWYLQHFHTYVCVVTVRQLVLTSTGKTLGMVWETASTVSSAELYSRLQGVHGLYCPLYSIA